MNLAQKALWYIESHLADALTLDEIAGVGGVSRFHMVRAFAAATGLSVMRYVRARRLSEAARALAAGAPDILSLALDADYGSHEAFTRAFRDHFGVTPEAVRGRRVSTTSDCRSRSPWIQPLPTICKRRVLRPASRCSSPASASATIARAAPAFPASGIAFINRSRTFPAGSGKVAYGVCCNGDDAGNFDYIAGVEVSDFSDLPREFSQRAHSRTEIRRVHPPRPHLDHSPHRQHDLEPLAAGIGPEGGRCAQLRAL